MIYHKCYFQDYFDDLKGVLFPDETDSALGDSQNTETSFEHFGDLNIHDTPESELISSAFSDTILKRKRRQSSDSTNELSGIENISSDSSNSDSMDLFSKSSHDGFDSFLHTTESDASLLGHRQDSGIGASYLSCASTGSVISPNKRASLECFSQSLRTTPVKNLNHDLNIVMPVFKNQITFSPAKLKATSASAIVNRLFTGFDINLIGKINLSFEEDNKSELNFLKPASPLKRHQHVIKNKVCSNYRYSKITSLSLCYVCDTIIL